MDINIHFIIAHINKERFKVYKEFGISDELINLEKECEKELEPIFKEIDKNCLKATSKVLKAFQDNKVSRN